jgi:hypothetical protein
MRFGIDDSRSSFKSVWLLLTSAVFLSVATTGFGDPDTRVAVTPVSAVGTGQTTHSALLDSQLASIAAEVDRQLAKKDAVDNSTDGAGSNLAASLQGVLKGPLTDDQLGAILKSLRRQHFLIDPFPFLDVTKLEIQSFSGIWVDTICRYVAEKPVSAEEKQVITKQIDVLFNMVETQTLTALKGRGNKEAVSQCTAYHRARLRAELEDPVSQWLRRRFTPDEMVHLNDMIKEDTVRAAVGAETILGPEFAVTGFSANDLLARTMTMQYSAPTLDSASMEQMFSQRKALVKERQLKYEHMSEEEQRREDRRKREQGLPY